MLCTSGSAGANYYPAVIEAAASRLPLIVLTADRPADLHHCGTNQTIDQLRLFGSHVRWFADIGAPASADDSTPESGAGSVAPIAARAVHEATASPPGPVHLNVHYRKPLWAPGESVSSVGPAPVRVIHGVSAVTAAQAGVLAAQLSSHPRGVIVCGPRPTPDAETGRAFARSVSRLATRLGWPVLAEPASNLRFSRAAEGVVATADALLRADEIGASLAPTLVLRFGQAPISAAVNAWLRKHASGRTILVDADGWHHDPDHLAAQVVVAPAGAFCDAVGAALPKLETDAAWRALWTRADQAARQALDDTTAAGTWEGAVARTIVECLPEGAALHVSNSMPIRDLDSFAPPLHRDIQVFVSRGANGIDGTVATACGESLAWTGGPTLLLTGDLALLHDIGSVRAAAQLGARLSIVVIDNGGGGIFELLPIAAHEAVFERAFLTPQQADLVGLCRAAGARVTEVGTLEELRRTVAADLERAAVTVTVVRVDRTENLSRHTHAWAAVRQSTLEKMDVGLAQS